MDHRDWIIAGRRLGYIGRGNQWWIGDWVRYGTARWGERYAEAARITGYDPRSLANMASIASMFPPSRRRDNLTWSHHAAVAGLSVDEQDRWLDFAATSRLSVADLRTELRSAEHTTKRGVSHGKSSCPTIVVCPRCQCQIPVSSQRGHAGSKPLAISQSTQHDDQQA
jgi:hypothetical protein